VALLQFAQEEAEGTGQQQAGNQHDAADQGAIEHWLVEPAGRAAHDALLDRLEGERQAEQHGSGHVDPEDLQRRDRQRRAGQDGGDDDQALAEIGRQRPGDELDQVVPDAPALLDRRLDAGEIVIGEHHGGRFLGHLGAAQSHRDPNVGLLEGRRIIDAVAGHRHHLALALQGAHQAQFLFRFDPGEDIDGQRGFGQRRVVKPGQVAAGQHPFGGEADLPGDGLGGDGVVAGDHLDPDAGRVAVADGGDGCAARRIDHADQADQRQVGPYRVGERGIGGDVAPGEEQYAHALSGIGAGGLFDGVAIERHRIAIRRQLGDAQGQQAFEGTLDVKHVAAVGAMGGRHVLPAGVEGQHVVPREQGGQRTLVQPALACRHQQRRLGRVAGDLPAAAFVAQRGVVAQGAGDQAFAHRAGDCRRHFVVPDGAVGRVALALHRIAFAAAPQDAHRHGVLGQRAGLVGADHRRAAQRLDRRQVADDGAASRHAGDADGQRDGDGGRQAFRNGADGERDGGHEHVEGRLAAGQPDGEGQPGQPADRPEQPVGEARHLAGERCRQIGGGSDQAGDAAGFGSVAGGDDQAATLPGNHRRTGPGHVAAVGEQRIGRQGSGLLADRL